MFFHSVFCIRRSYRSPLIYVYKILYVNRAGKRYIVLTARRRRPTEISIRFGRSLGVQKVAFSLTSRRWI